MSGIYASEAKSRSAFANKSLLHDRVLPDWKANGQTPPQASGGQSDMKSDFLDLFIKGTAAAAISSRDRDLYAAALARRNSMITAIGGMALTARTEWNFVTGTGLENPSEVGLQWHPIHGVPYWPGSSVKGMMRAYALTMAQDATPVMIAELFGEGDVEIREIYQWPEDGAEGKEPKKSKEHDGHGGQLIVFDALPEKDVKVIQDVMTPHFSDWYKTDPAAKSIKETEAPGDWLNPVPLPFLVVPPDTTFHFGLALRDGDPTLLDTAQRWLQEALTWIGGGAKTAAGYGRFHDLRAVSP